MKYKDNVRKQFIKHMLYSYLHSFNNKRTESLKNWSRPWYNLSPWYYSGTVQVWVGQPTLLTRHSWVAWVDAKESRRLRTWASASLKSRKKVAKESQSKRPFSFTFINKLKGSVNSGSPFTYILCWLPCYHKFVLLLRLKSRRIFCIFITTPCYTVLIPIF